MKVSEIPYKRYTIEEAQEAFSRFCSAVEAAKNGRASVACKAKTRTVFVVRELQKKLLRYAAERGIKSGMIYTLLQATGEGHVYLPKDELFQRAAELLGVDSSYMEKHLVDLAMDGYETSEKNDRDAKSALQEYLQALGEETPTYEIIGQDGPPHARVFTARVLRADGSELGTGVGARKQRAEEAAAQMALQKLNKA